MPKFLNYKRTKSFCRGESILTFDILNALVAELVDALDSKSSSFGSVGSIPTQGTFNLFRNEKVFLY